jgi:hypothetical protein
MQSPVDESTWPIVTVRWTGTLPDHVLSEFLTNMDIWLERQQPFGLLVDSRGAGGMSPEQRRRVVKHMKARAAVTAELLVQAVVLDSQLQRTLFYGINLLFPNPFPSKVFANVGPARQWLVAELRSRGIHPPEDT